MPLAPILVVEDDPDDEILTLRALKRARVANPIDVARDGQEALDRLLRDDPEPGYSVVLLDLKLPKVDGLDVLRRLREDERTRLLPVVVLTSSDLDRDLVESYRLGANSYVSKPVGFDDFSDAVGKVGLYWAVVNRAPARSDEGSPS